MLAGRLGEKLDHKIGSYYWARNWAIQFSEMDDPISDPISRSIYSGHLAAEWCQTKMDHTIGSEIGSSFSINKLGHEIRKINDPIFLTHVLCSISRAKVSIQFCVSDPIFLSNFPFSFQLSDPPFRSNISASQPAVIMITHI